MKNDFGLKGVRERQCEGNEVSLKNCHICYIKLKICIFRGLGSSETLCMKLRNILFPLSWFRGKL